MATRRSPLVIVAAVAFAASLLLALTLPDREPRVRPCPIGQIDPTGRCGQPVDHRTPERVAIAVVGVVLAGGLLFVARRLSNETGPGEGYVAGSSPPDDPT
jgi:hypothetical protein